MLLVVVSYFLARNDENSHSNFSVSEASVSNSVVVSSSAAANLVMLVPNDTSLTGFHNKDDALSICEGMRMQNGQFWPVPVLNLLRTHEGISEGDVVALKDPNVEDCLSWLIRGSSRLSD